MHLIYYKSPIGNFGDDLNEWLWPKLLPRERRRKPHGLVGIGSILFNDFPGLKNCANTPVVFLGTGVRASNNLLQTQPNWDIRFVRGPLSACSISSRTKYIADGAYGLRLTDIGRQISQAPKKYKVSVIPYFKSLNYANWDTLCKKLDYHLINPLSPNGVLETMHEIAQSEVVITEAMHGAIVADALGVPWHRFVFSTPETEEPRVSEFKWADWQMSIDLLRSPITAIPFTRRSVAHTAVKLISFNTLHIKVLPRPILARTVIEHISAISHFQCSSSKTLSRIDDEFQAALDQYEREYSL